MKLSEAIAERNSCRAFSTCEVSREDITELIEAGIRAPSKGNSQIWEFVAVMGEKKRAMDEMLFNLLKTDFIPSMTLGDAATPAESEAMRKAGARSSRNREEIVKILAPYGQTFEAFMLEGTFTFFKAPVAILVFVDEVFSKDLPHILSVGAAVQNVLLAATEKKFGTCWIGGVWRYTKEIRDLLGIPGNKKLLSSIALGYVDPYNPMSRYKSSRDDIGEFVRWIGFDKG
ncbi:MAG: nitroreductase [Deltaproteobacteria bacterium]|nr:nitroreductase [Deltaproteobacteria bacterium]